MNELNKCIYIIVEIHRYIYIYIILCISIYFVHTLRRNIIFYLMALQHINAIIYNIYSTRGFIMQTEKGMARHAEIFFNSCMHVYSERPSGGGCLPMYISF